MKIDLEAEYNNRARVPEHPAHIAGWARDAETYRLAAGDRLQVIDYGPSERQKIDFFGRRSPTRRRGWFSSSMAATGRLLIAACSVTWRRA